jgi:hypothetical protein
MEELLLNLKRQGLRECAIKHKFVYCLHDLGIGCYEMTSTASPREHFALANEPPKSKRAGHGRAWTPEADLNLSEAWVKISEDARTVTGQKQDKFWRLILAAAKSIRSVCALTFRCRSIRHNVSKICGLFEAAVKLDASDKNDEDRFSDCLVIFPELPWNASGQEFQYVECWQYLKKKPKWQFDRAAGQRSRRYPHHHMENPISMKTAVVSMLFGVMPVINASPPVMAVTLHR